MFKHILPLVALAGIATPIYAQTTDNYPTSVVFAAAEGGVNSYRIPSMVVAKDGSVHVFAEARLGTWRDKSRTDIVTKYSTDKAKSWEGTKSVFTSKSGAFMDPCPLLDPATGTIHLFAAYWPEKDHSGATNLLYYCFSTDNGKTWSKQENVTEQFSQEGWLTTGLGPGMGICMRGNKFKGRLILPIRQLNKETKQSRNRVAYSDDQGKSWKLGGIMETSDEFHVAESPSNHLIANVRKSGVRVESTSSDGGITWGTPANSPELPTTQGGCQASLYGKGNTLYFAGITGTKKPANGFDNRCNLTLWKSAGDAKDFPRTWNKKPLTLYTKGAGYTGIDFLPDGDMLIVFEGADTPAFTKAANRGKDWMQIRVLRVPKSKLK